MNKVREIVEGLGGPLAVATLCKVTRSRVYKWMSPLPKGLGGIPPRYAPILMDAIKDRGLPFTYKDVFERVETTDDEAAGEVRGDP
jgi:hypothetical protein